jgi:hypothetical protein
MIKKSSTIAVIPVHGRIPLLKKTIERLIHKNGCEAVICAGLTDEEKEACESSGAIFITKENKPLSDKWNACFEVAGEFNPSSILFMGSSDWVSDNWVPYCETFIRSGVSMVGHAGMYLLDIRSGTYRVCYWPGYSAGKRVNEPIGIGRLISAKILSKMNWAPIDAGINSSIDWSIYQNILKLNGRIECLNTNDIKSISISTDQWPNMHIFEDHWSGVLKSKHIDNHNFLPVNFPEAFTIFK